MKNTLILLMVMLCACAFTAWAQKSRPAGKPGKPAAEKPVRKPAIAAADTSIKAPTNIAADTSIHTSANIAADTTADTSIHTSTNIAVDTADTVAAVINDDDDLDDDRILAEIALDTTPLIRPDIIRREHDYRRQTRLAIVMMIFIAAALGTSQSWNPK